MTSAFQTSDDKYRCACMLSVKWLAPDGRCKDCTCCVPDEVLGNINTKGCLNE
jgi:hypothetical protein